MLRISDLELDNATTGDIAVIGVSLRTAFAENAAEFWHNLVSAKDCIHDIPDERQTDTDNYLPHLFRVKLDEAAKKNKKRYLNAGYLKDIDRFDYRFFRMSPKEASLLDPAQRVFLEVAYEVMEDAGYAGEFATGSDTGVYAGYSDDVKLNYFQMVTTLEPESIPVAIAGNLSSIVPTRISYFMDLKGPGILVDTACSSSLVAVHLACQAIRNGDCRQAIAGGVRINLVPIAYTAKVGIESSDGRTRTFDDTSDGTGTGEGAAAVLLKSLDHALHDRDHIYAVIKGSAVNQDGQSLGITAPNAAAQTSVLVKAWKDAGIDPETISFIEAHGTATRVGDPIEVEAITKAFRQFTSKKQFCAVGSVKSNIGHLFEASGIFGLIKAVLMLKHKTLPPLLHFNRPNRNIAFEESPVYINDELREWKTDGFPLRCGVTAFGFSGTNCHVVLEEAPIALLNHRGHEEHEGEKDGEHLLTLSAKTFDSLLQLVRRYREFLGHERNGRIGDICFTANTGRTHFNHRLAVIAGDAGELKTKLDAFLDSEPRSGQVVLDREQDIYYGEHKPAREDTSEASLIGNNRTLADIAQLYSEGSSLDWGQFYTNGTYNRVPLPLYPFERSRCWLDIPVYEDHTAKPLQGKLFFDMEWIEEELQQVEREGETVSGGESPGVTLVIKDEKGFGEKLAGDLREEGRNVIEITMGKPFERLTADHYRLDGSESHYEKMLLALSGRPVEKVVFLATLLQSNAMGSLTALQRSQKRGAYNLFHLTKMLLKHYSTEKIEYIVIVDHVNKVSAAEKKIKPENAPLLGLTFAIDQECENITTRCIDVDARITPEQLIAELKTGKQYRVSAYRENQRYIERFIPLEMEETADSPVEIKNEGVYLITGGTGGIGLEMGKFLASRKTGACIALVNRSPMPESELWDDILDLEEDKRTCRKITAIREMEECGATVCFYSADCSNRSQMKMVLDELRKRFGRINGIIHSAGVEGEGLLVRKSEKKFTNVLNPKVAGTWILDRLTKEDNLDFLVLFSTVATFLMNPGQTDYTAANAFLDSFSYYRNMQGKKTVAVNWVTWKETGMAVNFNANFDIIFKAIPTAQAIDALDEVMQKKLDRVLVGELNLESKLINLLKNAQFSLSAPIRSIIDTSDHPLKSQTPEEQRKKVRNVKLTGRDDGQYSKSELLVAKVWGEVLGFGELKVDDNFYELGGDSILATQVVNRINTEHNLRLSLIEIFNYETIKELAEYVESLL
jgi:acyl transferase domain-containing protein/acyl carrier protein